MHSRYEYGRDKRTDKEYKQQNYVGKYNQYECIKEYVTQKKIFENVDINVELQEEELFGDTDAKIKDYKPDCKILTPAGSYWVEIKVDMSKPKEDVHIKQNQIDKLVQLGGYIFYSMRRKYFIHSAKYIKEESTGIAHSHRLHKMCYIIGDDKLKWVNWQHLPNYKNYYKEYGNNTQK